MRRLLLPSALVLLSGGLGALAAPAPGPALARSAYLTHADLASLPWPAPRRDRQDDGPASRGLPGALEGLTPAVWLPQSRFRSGDPVPVYFLLRNSRNEARGVDMRLDLHGPRPSLRNSVSVDVTDLDTGKPVPYLRSRVWACGGPSPVVVPARGYYAVRADLGRVGSKALPAGRYAVSWRYQGLRSAEARFTVRPGAGPPPPARRALAWWVLDQKAGAAAGSELRPLSPGEVAATLGSGQTGTCYPDPYHLPRADGLLVLKAAWKKEGTLALTLAPREAGQVALPDELHVALRAEVEWPGPQELPVREDERKKGDAKHGRPRLAPQALEVMLPPGWRARVGKGRVSVVVSSRPFTMPRRELSTQVVREVSRARRGSPNPPPVWSGVLTIELPE